MSLSSSQMLLNESEELFTLQKIYTKRKNQRNNEEKRKKKMWIIIAVIAVALVIVAYGNYRHFMPAPMSNADKTYKVST